MKKINPLKTLKQINSSLAKMICDDILETDSENTDSDDDDLMQGQIKKNVKVVSNLIS